jgi:DNA-binding NtrC family response regulator
MNPGPSVLIVDDEAFVRDSLSEVLAAEGWRTHTAVGAREAVELLSGQRVDVIFTDLRMPGGDAFLLLEQARAGAVEIPIIVITGVGTVSEAVRAMKAGAFDFLQKPVDPEELVLLARRAAEHRRLLSEVKSLRDTIQGLRAPRVLVGSSERMARVRGLISQVAPTDTAVLITGETGTGKELAAEEIHRQSRRATRPLRRVHCAAVSEGAFENELFGRDRGALAEAEGGTLVLDEIGVLTPALQTKLLRVLETGEYQSPGDPTVHVADVRLIAITNEDLPGRVKSGSFRADLFYRLNVFPIPMPPLREHREDVPGIVDHFLDWARRQLPGAATSAAAPRIGTEALEVLSSYGWPGNVRELRNVLERAAILAGERELDAALVRGILESALSAPLSSAPRELHLRKNLDAAEREIILRALAQTQGKKKEAALLLGIDPRNLGYYLRKHGIADAKAREESEA